MLDGSQLHLHYDIDEIKSSGLHNCYIYNKLHKDNNTALSF